MTNDEITWGKRMIKVSLHFWTDNLPKKTDKKTAWASGAIYLAANKQRGLKPDGEIFNNMEEFMPKLQKLLERNRVKLIKSERYVKVDLTKIGNRE